MKCSNSNHPDSLTDLLSHSDLIQIQLSFALSTSSFDLCSSNPNSTRFSLTKNKIIWPEDLSERAGTDRVHGARLQVHQDGTGDKLIAC